jgi:hypothetical protein
MNVVTRGLCAGLSVLCIGAAVQSLRTGMAATLSNPVQQVLVAGERRGAIPAEALVRAAGSVAAARRWSGDSAELNELSARIALQRAMAATDAERAVWFRLALQEATAAVSARPRWPYAAAQEAVVRDASGDQGPNFIAAVERAWTLGRNESRVQRMLAGLWLRDAARESAVGPLLRRAFDRQAIRAPSVWIDAADRSGVAEEACAGSIGRVAARCRELGVI